MSSTVGLERQGSTLFYKGKPLFISSVDCETVAADTRYDLGGMLDLFVRHGFNKIRLWAHCWHGAWTGPPECFLRPWKSVPGSGGWSDMRFDLDRWNDAYWRRMREFCAAALERDFIVEISLFGEWIKDFHDMKVREITVNKWWNDELARPEWNSMFNVNGAFSTNKNGDFWPEFCNLNHVERSLSGKSLYDYQKAYIDKAIQEFDEFPNVYYELFNEFPPFPQAKEGPAGIDEGAGWQNYWAEYLKQRTKRLVGVNAHQIGAYQGRAVGVENFQDKPFVDVLNFHWFSGTEPSEIAEVARPLHQYGKVLANNEGEWYGVTGPILDMKPWLQRITKSIWGMFMAGSHYSLTDFPPEVGNPRWVGMANRFQVLRKIAETMRFWELRPVDGRNQLFDSLITEGPGAFWRIITSPGREYLVYFWSKANNQNVITRLPAGTYDCEWYDTRDGRNLLANKTESRDGVFHITSPIPDLWDEDSGLALVIRRKDVPKAD